MANVIQGGSMKVSSWRISLHSHVQGEGFRGRPPAVLIKAKTFAFPLPPGIQGSCRQTHFPLRSRVRKLYAESQGNALWPWDPGWGHTQKPPLPLLLWDNRDQFSYNCYKRKGGIKASGWVPSRIWISYKPCVGWRQWLAENICSTGPSIPSSGGWSTELRLLKLFFCDALFGDRQPSICSPDALKHFLCSHLLNDGAIWIPITMRSSQPLRSARQGCGREAVLQASSISIGLSGCGKNL